MSSYTNYPIPLNFQIGGLHETGEVLRCPLMKRGVDQHGLYDYGYSTAKADRYTPAILTVAGNAYVDSDGLHLDGDVDAVSIPHSADLTFLTGDFTIGLWIYAAAVGQLYNSEIVTKLSDATQPSPFSLILKNGTYDVALCMAQAAQWDLVDTATVGTVVQNTWNHLALTREGSQVRTFLNGELKTTHDIGTSSLYNTATPFRIGGGNYVSTYFNGMISDLLVLKGKALYTESFTPPARGSMVLPQDLYIFNPHVVVHYPLRNSLEDWSKGVAKISPSVQHKASLVGSGTLSVNGFTNTGSTGNYISVADSPDYVATTFYMAFSVTFNAGGNHGIVGQSNGGGGNLKWAVYLNAISSGSLSLHMQNPSGSGYNMNFTWTPTPGTKYRIEFSRSGTTLSCWANGSPLGTQSMAVGLPNVGTDLRIGADGEAWQALNGTISDFIFLNGTSVAPDSNYDHHMQDLVITRSSRYVLPAAFMPPRFHPYCTTDVEIPETITTTVSTSVFASPG